MQRRYILLLTLGVVFVGAVGFGLYKFADQLGFAPESQVNEVVIAVNPSLMNQPAEDEAAGAGQGDAQSDELSLAQEEREIEPVFAITLARVSPDGSAIFGGVAEPGAVVQLQDGSVLIDEVLADERGEWVSQPDEKISAGQHLIILTMRTKDGRMESANMSLVVEVSESGDEKPLVALVPQTDDAQPVLLQSPDMIVEIDIEIIEVDMSSSLAQQGTPSISIGSLSLNWSGNDTEGALRITGRSSAHSGGGSAGATIEGQIGDTKLTGVTIDAATGHWSGLVDVAKLDDKPARLEVALMDANGGQMARATLMLDKKNLSIALGGDEVVIVQKGDALWRIAYRAYGKGTRYVEIVRRNQSKIANPDLIYPNQMFVVPK